MNVKKAVALVLSAALIIILTLAAMKKVDWLWFYLVAGVAVLYLWFQKRSKKQE
ncbi:MAG: hypothetical protein AABY13_05750 [Nanoarchaeota archaeon]